MTSVSLRDDWLALLAAQPGGSVFLHPEMLAEPILHAHRGPGGELASLAAFAPKVVPGVVKLRGVRLVGDQILGDTGPEAMAAFKATVDRLCETADCVLVEDVEVGSPVWEALAGHQTEKPQPHWRIVFPETPGDYWAEQFSKKARYNLRRSCRLLDHTVTCYRRPEDVEAFLTHAAAVSRASWQAKRFGVRVRGTDAERVTLGTAARLGALRSYVLFHHDQPLAFVLGYQWNGRYAYEEIAYDAAWAKQSPGSVLLVGLIDDLIGRDTPREVDFGLGDAEYKRLFGNRQTASGPQLVVAPRWRPRLAVRLAGWRRGLARLVRCVGGRLNLWPTLRRLYRR